MKGHFRKLLGFLASMNSDNYVNYRRPLQLPVQRMQFTKERIHVYVTISGEGEDGLNKHPHFVNNTTPRRRKSQPVRRERKVTESEALSGLRCNFGPVITEDFENEIWSSLQKRSTFSVTSVEDGWLTTTLCSTEL